MDRKIKRWIALPVFAFCLLLTVFCRTEAFASPDGQPAPTHTFSVGDRVDGGVIVANDGAYYCACCHEHNHPDTLFGRINCLLCRVKQIVWRLADKTPGGEHVYRIVNDLEPTCTDNGAASLCCAKCGDVQFASDVLVPATGHKPVTDPAAEATCYSTGLTEGSHCGTCGLVLKAQEVTAQVGHDFADGDTVTALATDPATNTVTATFVCRFCGETRDNEPIEAEGSVGGYERVYHTLRGALAAAKKGEAVYLLRDTVLDKDLTVGSGVTLVLPCFDADPGYVRREDTGDDYPLFCPDNPGTEVAPAVYRTLTVPAGKTLTVGFGGTLLVNAVTGQTVGGGNDYGVTGGYARLVLGGKIIVKNGGTFDCSGVTEDLGGSVEIESGGTMYETFAIKKFRGGSYSLAAFVISIFPLDEYEMNGMRAPLTLHAGAALTGTAKIFASGEYQYSHFRQVADDDALMMLRDGATCVRTLSGGVSEYRFTGDVVFGDSGMALFALFGDMPYKLNGNVRLMFFDGNVTLDKALELLPGFSMVIGKGAVLETSPDAMGFFCTGEACEAGGKQYPSYYDYDGLYAGLDKLYTPGRGDAALYVLDGGKVKGDSVFAGRVYADGSSSFTSATGERVSSVNVACGAVDTSTYHLDYNVYELPLLYETLTGDALAAARAKLGLD
ncbi:MAG: hypothetical protein IK104_06380 [Clostridia bacterium]|nr:hypothetical protein [Clostridia bacterium]